LVGLPDEIVEQDGIACNVKQVYRDERYGQQLFQPGNFFNLEKFQIAGGKFLGDEISRKEGFTQRREEDAKAQIEPVFFATCLRQTGFAMNC